MGSRGPIANPKSVGHRRHETPQLHTAPPDAPPSPAGLLKQTRDDWDAFWREPVAALVQPGDLPALRHLFELRDQRARILLASRGSNALAKGSQGQDVVNPLLRQLPAINRDIREGEKQFGMTPSARARLVASAPPAERPTLAELLDALEAEAPVEEPEDPRLVVLQGGAA